MRERSLAGAILFTLFLVACGSGDPATVGVSTGTAEEPTPTVPRADASQLYEANATVLDATDGPMLCLGGILLSVPPQCGDVPIANWDWEAVGGERSIDGTTWGDYHVVGRFDGEVFTVTEIGPFARADEPETYVYENPCPEPEGGWVAPDPEHNTQEDARRAHAYARSQPDYVISWNDHLDKELQEFSPVVFVAVFTGPADHHETAIREVWDGPLCVVERDIPTAQELTEIRKEVEARLPDLGLQLLGSGTGGFPPMVFIDVVADEDGWAQALVDEEYGPEIVRFLPALRPVQ